MNFWCTYRKLQILQRAEGAPLFLPLHHRGRAKLDTVELGIVNKREVIVPRPQMTNTPGAAIIAKDEARRPEDPNLKPHKQKENTTGSYEIRGTHKSTRPPPTPDVPPERG
jgi:hypothetical protein